VFRSTATTIGSDPIPIVYIAKGDTTIILKSEGKMFPGAIMKAR